MLLFSLGFLAGLICVAPPAWWLARRRVLRARDVESRARQAERLAELVALTGGLAHEIKNPLATLRLNLELLAEDWQDAEASDVDDLRRRGLAKLRTLRRETDRLNEILEDFLRYAGKHELKLAVVDLAVVVRELLEFYAPQAQAASLRLRPGLTGDPLPVRLDADLFKQAVLNLLLNAQQAMAECGGGELMVRTSRQGDNACVEVADTGPGIPAEQLSRIFEAYYTTKRGGTGLGLPTAKRIVSEHGGRLDVHSEPGRGSSFTIRLPLADTV